MRRTHTRGRSALIALSALALTAAAILPAGVAAQDAEPVSGGTLVVAADGAQFPPNLNPAIVASNGVFLYSNKIVEPLFEQGYEGLEPRLATEWEVSDDGLEYTFHLREGVTWHDGEPFTSADVKFSAEEVWKPLQNIGRSVLANLDHVDTPDENTAVFVFSQPTPPDFIAQALPVISSVLPAHIYQGQDLSDPASPLNQQLVGTGPFKFGEMRPGELLRLTKNEDYYVEGQPYLDEIVFTVLPDATTRAAALEEGDVQATVFAAIPRSDLARVDALDGIAATTTGYEAIPYQATLDFNHRNEVLADVKVRQAIAQAIDQQFVVDTIFQGFGATPANGPIPPTSEFYTDDKTSYAFDPAAAAAALDEAGYPVGPDGTRFTLRLRAAPFFPETVAIGEYVKQALEEIGIGVEIVAAADTPAYLAAVYKDHDFDLSINSPVFRGDPAISTTILYQGGLEPGINFTNQWGYQNAEVDGIIEAARSTVDSEQRNALFDRFQQVIADELPNFSIVDFTFVPAHSERVGNISNNPRWAVSNWADTWLAPES
ncbi:MAG: ABC transporter substrate-binding protein [Candidatus Limnocylindrales bacterium]